MSTYRLITETGTVVAESAHENDQQAIAWRSRQPFGTGTTGAGRQLRLERLTDDGWVRLDALGTAEVT